MYLNRGVLNDMVSEQKGCFTGVPVVCTNTESKQYHCTDHDTVCAQVEKLFTNGT